MSDTKVERHNRLKEALGKIYEDHPPYLKEYLRRYEEDPCSRVFAPLADAYRKMGRLDEALQICKDGIKHHPEFHGGRVALAKCWIEKQHWTEARAELERVVHASPENLLAQRLLGDVTLQLGESDTALHAYKMALMLSPADVVLAEKVHALEREAALFLHQGGVSRAPVVGSRIALDSAERPSQSLTSTIDDSAEIEPLWKTHGEKPHGAKTVEPSIAVQGDQAEGQVLEALFREEDIPTDDEGFKVEHVSHLFEENNPKRRKEITTETLGDLYFSQGQFEKALRIFEKLSPGPALRKKIKDCKLALGVDLVRVRNITLLRGIVKATRLAQNKSVELS